MAFVFSVVLLVLAGGIHSSPIPGNFSFEVSLKKEVIIVRFGEDAVINCKTNDASAIVTFKVVHSGHPSNDPQKPGKITKSGTTFTIHDITVRDGGKYQCVAERKDGQIITRDILLTFDTRHPDVFIIPFVAKRILTGSSLTYSCEGTLGRVTWSKVISGTPVELPMPSLAGVSVKSSFGKYGIAKKDLIISKADSSHIGVYECRLDYKGKTMEKSVQVDVRGPDPAKIIGSSSHDIWVDSDRDITLDCRTIGFPPPVITWKKDNQTIKKCYKHEPCAQAERYILTDKGLKIVKPRYPDDDAVFSCEAKNSFGKDYRDFVVIIPTAPVLDKSYAKTYTWSQHQTKGILIPCVLAEGSPTPSFSWDYAFCWSYRDADCTPWQSIQQKPTFQAQDENTKSTLVIARQLTAQILKFKCTVQNVVGSDEMIAKLYQQQTYFGR